MKMAEVAIGDTLIWWSGGIGTGVTVLEKRPQGRVLVEAGRDWRVDVAVSRLSRPPADQRSAVMFRASVDNLGGYAHHAYASTEDEARLKLAEYIFDHTDIPLENVHEVGDYFGINTEPVLAGVFCEAYPEHNLEG